MIVISFIRMNDHDISRKEENCSISHKEENGWISCKGE